jgi:threonine synthase
MHPHNRISGIQERQMTSVPDANVFNMAIDGTFDDCQRIMKDIFRDLAFKDRYALGSVNSINWARVLAQIVYYFYAAFRVMERTGAFEVTFSVPTGNFGDILAGYVAYRMGLPVRRLMLATNENDILSRFFNTGVYSQGDVVPTISPSMDIQVASNFERYLYYRVGEDPERLSRLMKPFASDRRLAVTVEQGRPVDPLFTAAAGNTQETLAAIRRVHRDYGYLLDPHAAVGVHVALREMRAGEAVICLATAHPAKFSQAIIDATGADLARHPVIDGLKDLPTRMDVLPAALDAVRAYMEQRMGGPQVRATGADAARSAGRPQ